MWPRSYSFICCMPLASERIIAAYWSFSISYSSWWWTSYSCSGFSFAASGLASWNSSSNNIYLLFFAWMYRSWIVSMSISGKASFASRTLKSKSLLGTDGFELNEDDLLLRYTSLLLLHLLGLWLEDSLTIVIFILRLLNRRQRWLVLQGRWLLFFLLHLWIA